MLIYIWFGASMYRCWLHVGYCIIHFLLYDQFWFVHVDLPHFRLNYDPILMQALEGHPLDIPGETKFINRCCCWAVVWLFFHDPGTGECWMISLAQCSRHF